jgi:Pyruvate/2-oxoacid:ferredoxin oxidoreductase gamma subunit
MTNVVMLGALTKAMSFFDYNEMKWLVSANSPTRFKEANVMGFEEGYKLIN